MKDVQKVMIQRSATLREALRQQDAVGLGILLVVDEAGVFERTLTDGDLRRLVLQEADLQDTLADLPAIDAVTLPQTGSPIDAMNLMNVHEIDHIPVIGDDGRPAGVYMRKELDARIYLSRPHLGGEEIDFIEAALQSNWVAPLGPNVDAFESEMAAYLGVDSAAAVISGTAAIHLALRLVGVQRGDTVLCSSLTFVASANPILYLGAEPIFVDSEPESWNCSPSALERAIKWAEANGKRPKAAVIVNLYGQSADFDAILEICDRYDIAVVEDAAESLGATYKGKPSGSIGRLAALSFNGNKIITTSGGGMLVSNDVALIEEARFLSTQARDPASHYEHSVVGYNYRMSNVLAGIGRAQLKILDERVNQRRRVFDWYKKKLADITSIHWMPEAPFGRMTRWLTAATISKTSDGTDSASLIRHLSALNIEARPVWKPMHRQPLFSGAPYFEHDDGESVSDALFDSGICLPSGSDLLEEQVDRICEEIRRHLGR